MWSFNPRAREGRDAQELRALSNVIGFNPRAREGRDVGCHIVAIAIAVSIHAPARGATRPAIRHGLIRGVSIHAPARGATNYSEGGVLCFARFNPRAREGRDFGDSGDGNPFEVSIHAPARGATNNSWCLSYVISGFNPRAREGRDPLNTLAAKNRRQVSIHAPARGATFGADALPV